MRRHSLSHALFLQHRPLLSCQACNSIHTSIKSIRCDRVAALNLPKGVSVEQEFLRFPLLFGVYICG
jgi:hypothetical protein